jgi:hypothetical protein
MKKSFLYIELPIILTCCLTLSSGSYAEQPYLQQNRVAYITGVLRAFSETKLHDLLNTNSYINVVEKNNCRSSMSDLKVECLLSYARKNCEATASIQLRGSCELYSDIVVVNKLSENVFIKRTERYHMLKNTSDDYRTAMASRLSQKYARIVTTFSLTEGSDCDNADFDCLARGLDQFCLDYTNTQSLSWQYCMSASLWFIGTSKKD